MHRGSRADTRFPRRTPVRRGWARAARGGASPGGSPFRYDSISTMTDPTPPDARLPTPEPRPPNRESHIPNPESRVPSVVIVGGGFGGLNAARALDGAAVRVTLVDRHNYHLFQPLLYQVATAALSPGDIASPIRWILRRQRNVDVLLGDVARIDAANRTAHLTDGATIPYDYAIVSAGTTHAYFGHDDWRAIAPGLKTLEDALDIRRR